jgi:hypothetical protein
MKQILLFFWIFVVTSCSFETVEKGKDVILVLVSSNTDSLKKQIPKTFHGYPVILKYAGEINAQ